MRTIKNITTVFIKYVIIVIVGDYNRPLTELRFMQQSAQTDAVRQLEYPEQRVNQRIDRELYNRLLGQLFIINMRWMLIIKIFKFIRRVRFVNIVLLKKWKVEASSLCCAEGKVILPELHKLNQTQLKFDFRYVSFI